MFFFNLAPLTLLPRPWMIALYTKLSKEKLRELAANTKALKVAVKKVKENGKVSVSGTQAGLYLQHGP